MSGAGEELNELATELERTALRVPRHLAVLALTVAAARIAGGAPPGTRASVIANGERGWEETLAGYSVSPATPGRSSKSQGHGGTHGH